MGQFAEWNRWKRAERRADKMLYAVAALGILLAFLVSSVPTAGLAVLLITMVGMSWAWAQANRAEAGQGAVLAGMAAQALLGAVHSAGRGEHDQPTF